MNVVRIYTTVFGDPIADFCNPSIDAFMRAPSSASPLARTVTPACVHEGSRVVRVRVGVRECGGQRERESVCVCVDVRNREVETRCDELRSKQDENEKRESDDERTGTSRGGESEPVY